MATETVSFIQACKKFFGLKEGQNTLAFAKEVKELSDQDRADLSPLLEKELGVTIQ